jgi:GntR family transcriptional repressor for pyruvate dehydrogenase complex
MSQPKQTSPETYRAMEVVNYVRSLIEAGSLQPGDRIPPERELARTLNISRASLRTGLGHLAAMGVMKVHHGVGTFVTEEPPDLGKASLVFMRALHGFRPWQMYEARIVLESNLAALAAERGESKHHAVLVEKVERMQASVNDPATFLIHDVLFHRTVAQASGNPILAAIMETITSSIYEKRRRTVRRAVDLREAAEMHRKICRAIVSRKPREARRLMELHLRMAEAAQGTEQPGRARSNSTGKSTVPSLLTHKK